MLEAFTRDRSWGGRLWPQNQAANAQGGYSGTKIEMKRHGREERKSKYEKRNGRHEETRTPDLYRVKTPLFSTYNNLQAYRGLPSTCKHEHRRTVAG